MNQPKHIHLNCYKRALMSKKMKKILAATLMVVGVLVIFTMVENFKIMNLGILAVLVGLVWFIIS